MRSKAQTLPVYHIFGGVRGGAPSGVWGNSPSGTPIRLDSHSRF